MHLIHDQKNGREQIWVSVEDYGQGKVWEFHVFGLTQSGDIRTCPSIGMAFELLGADPRPALEACPSLGEDGPREAA